MKKLKVSKLIDDIGKDFTEGLENILGKKLHGIYVYGAAAFLDTLPTGDIDFHVILKSSLTRKERSYLENFHKLLAQKYPPLGRELDGYYILLEDACRSVPPKSQMWKRAIDKSWALHREHILAGRCITFFGPDPKEIYPPATWPEIKKALYHELDFVKKNLEDYPDYCILNLCRLIYSFETKDVVVSKAQASNWGFKNLSQWKRHIELARKSYQHRVTLEDRQFMLSEVKSFFVFAKEQIEQTTKK